MLSYLSVCSGVEAASVAWEPLGWKPVAFSEIEPFPSAVLAHHWPDVPNLGDMTEYENWKLSRDIDLLVGGTPCQAFSVAGLREGLADPRGNLTLTFLGLAEKFRPKWIVWENVAGVLSDKSNAFGQFIAGLSELGYDCAWRVLDAQYFGVAQRRRRVFVVGCAGGEPGSAAKVLFEPESLSGNPAPSRGERKDAAADAGESIAPTVIDRAAFNQGVNAQFDPKIEESETMETLVARGPHAVAQGGTVMSSGQANAEITHEVSPTLNCNRDGSPIAFGIQGNIIDRSIEHGGNGTGWSEEVSGTLTTGDKHAVAFAENSRAELRLEGGDGSIAGALSTGGGKAGQGVPCIAFSSKNNGRDCNEEVAPTLRAMNGKRANGGGQVAVIRNLAARRLTPTECERLQGFPDDHSRIPWRGKPASECPDGPRYKAMGNSMAVPVMRWIGDRIAKIEEEVAL